MAIRIALFLLIALGLSGLGAVIFMNIGKSNTAVVQEIKALPTPKTPILVAATVLRGGTLLVADDLTSLEVPIDAVPPGAWQDNLDTRTAVRGAMIRHQIEKGQIVAKTDVFRPGERGFLAAVLLPGMRAATIAVDAVSGTAGLIWAGDHVDVLLTQKLDDTKEAARRVAGETVLQNVRVIAVDKHMTEGEAPEGLNSNQRTVTVEVTPQDAQKLSVATNLGHLALIICSASDPADQPIANPVVWASDVSSAYRIGPNASPIQIVHVYAGSAAAAVEYHY
jgi:pilus assembly protein CpaB